jgi:hypothetical protein
MGDRDATKGHTETAILEMQGSGNGSIACSARYIHVSSPALWKSTAKQSPFTLTL